MHEESKRCVFLCLLGCTGIVAIGLAMEAGEIWHDTREAIWEKSLERKHWLTPSIDRKEYPARVSRCKKLFATVGWVLIVAGVVGEGVFEGFVYKYDLALSNMTDAVVAEAQKESANAEATAKGFDAQIAASDAKAKSAEAMAKRFEAQIADDNARTAQAELELARLKTPRTLSKEQLERISSKIKIFAGTPFDFWISSDSDSAALLELIKPVLSNAGWEFNAPEGLISYGPGKAGLVSVSGISCHVPQEHFNEWGDAIVALCAALSAENLPANPLQDAPQAEPGMKRDRIHIVIGSKPLN